jgi:oligoribonuclease NrnB/cAMP/cGMP phosphodiesterase (DHH superfamily)
MFQKIKKLDKNLIDFVIYHANCPDGLGSALAVYVYYKNNFPNKKIEFYPAAHGSNPPMINDKNVLICDFSYKKDAINKIINECKSFLIIDHHISAQKELEDLHDEYKIFDMTHSGAFLTWVYFFPNEEVPSLIKYIEDNDIWIKALPYTKEVTAYISILPNEIEQYEKLLQTGMIENIAIPHGKVLLIQQNKIIEKALNSSFIKFIDIGGNSYFVAMSNSATFQSEIGNQLLGKYVNCDFSVVYSENYGSTSISLRSANDRTDVSEIARRYGGGGHRNAAGCSLSDVKLLGHPVGGDDRIFKNLNNAEFVFNKIVQINNTSYTFNYVLLNETCYGYKIGNYFLQTKTIEEDKIIQKCCALYRHKNNVSNFYTKFDFSFTWNYENDKTLFITTWNKETINSEIVTSLFNKYDDFSISSNHAVFTLPEKRVVFGEFA